MQFVDERKVELDDTIERWLPDAAAGRPGHVANAGEPDLGLSRLRADPALLAAFERGSVPHLDVRGAAEVSRSRRPRMFAPGTNWSYSHTNFMILGEILRRSARNHSTCSCAKKVLDPLGLKNTIALADLRNPEPGSARVRFRAPACFESLRTSRSTRRRRSGTRNGVRRWREPDHEHRRHDHDRGRSRYRRAHIEVQLRSHDRPDLLGFGKKQDNCAPSCFTQVNGYNYGLGVVRSGSWILQNPLLDGYSATEAYLRSKKIAIAVATTFAPEAFDSQGNYANSSDTLFRSIGAYIAPDDAPPVPTPKSTKAAPSVADPSVQSAIVAAVENDRKRFGGHTPVPATLIGVWDAKGNSFIRAFGDADLEKKNASHSG